MTKRGIIGTIVAVVVLGAVIFFVSKGGNNAPPVTNSTASTTDSWEASNDVARGITFKYPKDINTKYINLFDWPPQVAVIDGPLTCTEAGTTTDRVGQTKLETINGHQYCVTTIVEGAAGSTYTQYAFAREVEGKNGTQVAILSFSLRAPQCGNYDEPKRTECQKEEDSFDIGPLIDQVFSTLQLNTPTGIYEKG